MTNTETLNSANEKRRSGRNEEADVIYNRLLSLEPNNTDYIFNKALNIINTNQNLSLDLFEKLIVINPDLINTYRNICILSEQSGQHNRELEIFDNYLKMIILPI